MSRTDSAGRVWLTVPEAAALLDIGRRTMQREVARGGFPVKLFGKRKYIPKDYIDGLVQSLPDIPTDITPAQLVLVRRALDRAIGTLTEGEGNTTDTP